jgi:N-acetylmuramoyl-L-alanine amidase
MRVDRLFGGTVGRTGVRGVVTLTFLALVALLPIRTAFASPAPAQFTSIRAEYIRLKNIDPSGEAPAHEQGWRTLDTQLRRFLESNPAAPQAVQARVMSSETALRLYRRTGAPEFLQRAERAVAPLVSGAVKADSASDVMGRALILAGDTALYRRAFSSAAERYERAVSTEERARALERLQGVRNGTFERFVPSHDLAAPKVIAGAPGAAFRPATLIVIDPGHGGEDAGAVSSIGGEEKEITLDVARRVAARLEQRHGLRVRLTRERDEFVPLARRTAVANQNNAAVFISLHVNASAGHDADGLEVYYLDNTNDEASRKLAERENGVVAGADLDDISFMLSDLIQSGKMEDSVLLSRKIEMALRARVAVPKTGLRSLGVKRAPFFVLVGAHMPCALIEMFFVDNPNDGAKLRQSAFRELLAVGISDGIDRFLRSER